MTVFVKCIFICARLTPPRLDNGMNIGLCVICVPDWPTPSFTAMEPLYGPVAGGTHIKLEGHNLTLLEPIVLRIGPYSKELNTR